MKIAKNSLIALVAVSVGMAGCVTTGTNASSQPSDTTASNDSGCNAAVIGLVGAVAGALLAKGNDRVRGAALGGGLGALACAAWNYHVAQTKTADQSATDYKRANAGRLPAQAVVAAFDTRMDPNGTIRPGSNMTVISNIEVVPGTSQANPVIEEELVLTKPDKSTTIARKRANPNGDAGAFQTKFSMTMPEGIPQGAYPVKTTLYVDGRATRVNDLKLQVVALPNGEMVASLR
jgi:hypothetical protein